MARNLSNKEMARNLSNKEMANTLSNEEAAIMLRAGLHGRDLGKIMRNKTRANGIRALAKTLAETPLPYHGSRPIRRVSVNMSMPTPVPAIVPNNVRRAALGKGEEAGHRAMALGVVKLPKSGGGTRRRRKPRRKSTRKH